MKTKQINAAITVALLFLGVCLAAPASAERIHIDFAGIFESCFPAPSCAGSPFLVLENTPFSGTIEFPTSGIDLLPMDDERGLYTFGSPSFMTLTTANPMFSFVDESPVQVFVNNCIGATCAFNQDFVWISVTRGDHEFNLSLGTPRPPFATDAIPSVERLQGLYAAFGIFTTDFEHFISIDTENNPVVSPMTVTIELIPLPSAIYGFVFALVTVSLSGRTVDKKH